MSVKYGKANLSSFKYALEAALEDYPLHQIVIKVHPDTKSRKKKGYFKPNLLKNPRIKILSDKIHPSKLISGADAVYTVTSQVGFEALIWGKKVKCFGMPFYAGWGLTEDFLPAPIRRKMLV